MRAVLGLDAADAGSALLDGIPYAKLRRPLSHVGGIVRGRAAAPAAPPATTCCGWATHRA
jgi:ABC-2 type transport system ATP-binding protein